MEWLSVIVGVLLILVGLVDLFFTVLHYDGFGFLSSRLYNSLFDVARFVTRPLPRTYRALGLSMAAPLMVPVTITVWIFLVSLGYALVYYAGMDGRTFSFSTSGLEPSLMEAFYSAGSPSPPWASATSRPELPLPGHRSLRGTHRVRHLDARDHLRARDL